MNRRTPGLGRLFGIFLLLIMAVSCGRDDLPGLPDVPEFKALGFDDALDVVRTQVLGVYERWQENPLDAGRNGRLGMHLMVYGNHATAEILYLRARELAPGDFRWTYYLALTLSELGRLEEAARTLREALKIEPGNVSARIRLASLLLLTSDIEGSGNLYQSIADEFPERVEGWLGLGKVYTLKGDNEAAVTALRRARSVGPQFGEVRYALAMVLREIGDKEAAAHEFAAYERTATNRIPVPDKYLQNVIKLHIGDGSYMAKASHLFSQGQYRRAAVLYRDALAINPKSPDAWNGLVSVHVLLGEIGTAGDVYREALAAGVDFARLHLNYGVALLDAGRIDAARDIIGKAIELDPQYVDALSAMGRLEIRNGDYAAAAEQYRRSLASRPNDRHIRMSLAQSLNASGQFIEAAALLEILSTDPDVERSLALKELALAYRGLNRKGDALEALQRGWVAVLKTNNVPLENTIKQLLAEWQKESAE